MLVVSSPRFADHITPPGHPESPERADVLEAIAARAEGRGAEVVGATSGHARGGAAGPCGAPTSMRSRPRAGTRR